MRRCGPSVPAPVAAGTRPASAAPPRRSRTDALASSSTAGGSGTAVSVPFSVKLSTRHVASVLFAAPVAKSRNVTVPSSASRPVNAPLRSPAAPFVVPPLACAVGAPLTNSDQLDGPLPLLPPERCSRNEKSSRSSIQPSATSNWKRKALPFCQPVAPSAPSFALTMFGSRPTWMVPGASNSVPAFSVVQALTFTICGPPLLATSATPGLTFTRSG